MHVAFALLALLVSPSADDARHPFGFADLIAMQRLSELTASPDGKWLAFVVRTYSLEQNKSNADIWVVSADGKTLRQLTTSPAQDFSPCWSPAGNRLAFVSTR